MFNKGFDLESLKRWCIRLLPNHSKVKQNSKTQILQNL